LLDGFFAGPIPAKARLRGPIVGWLRHGDGGKNARFNEEELGLNHGNWVFLCCLEKLRWIAWIAITKTSKSEKC
jgi:hypothetical protein